ncbi:hypothetical protein MBM_09036 [Drepanopeziza brunnea f. sp. 'multigermtubi' MB_m1]|uniref:Uncharacterized protein n=1 Tax=Marssonina brunnea f. sp. multigermtubi (strain MB_m1) TaxID=1072389 RepID=K1WKN1_MARBU|nr:uncharacterized protein MBM_09036 [Drepanopeziza brunnea f. sp. 'multigermtubi' MB_m1]EKD12807.1 hypothetical protein MBM_09036 [Drepanopeziza brunnea f. sp. 'multigermtubi' MB_m1]
MVRSDMQGCVIVMPLEPMDCDTIRAIDICTAVQEKLDDTRPVFARGPDVAGQAGSRNCHAQAVSSTCPLIFDAFRRRLDLSGVRTWSSNPLSPRPPPDRKALKTKIGVDRPEQQATLLHQVP